MATVTINAHQLNRLIDRTIDHIADEFTKPLHGIRLEADATYLYAVASDKHTVAAARYRHQEQDGEPFTRTIPAISLDTLRAWCRAAPGSTSATLSANGDRVLASTADSELSITVDAHAPFFDWRGFLQRVAEQTADTAPVYPALAPRLLDRFRAVDNTIHLRVTSDHEPMLIVGEDFLGAQMPARRRDGIGPDNLAAFDAVRASWQHPLTGTDAAATPGDSPTQDHPRSPTDKGVADVAADLLQQTLRTTRAPVSGPPELAALAASAGVMAWMAYQALNALHTADPHLAATVTAETTSQIDSGEICELAWDAAETAGHDPQKWHDEWNKQLSTAQADAVNAV